MYLAGSSFKGYLFFIALYIGFIYTGFIEGIEHAK